MVFFALHLFFLPTSMDKDGIIGRHRGNGQPRIPVTMKHNFSLDYSLSCCFLWKKESLAFKASILMFFGTCS